MEHYAKQSGERLRERKREDAIVTVLTFNGWRNASETKLISMLAKKLLSLGDEKEAVGHELINYIDNEAKKNSSSKKIDL
jgi:hypothetical protein